MSVDQFIESPIDSPAGSPVVESLSPRTPRQLHHHHGAIATFVFITVMVMSVIGVISDATGARATEGPAAVVSDESGPAPAAEPTDMYTVFADIAAALAAIDAAAAQEAQAVQAYLDAVAPPAPAPVVTTWSPPTTYSAPEPAAWTDGQGRWDQLAQCESGGNWGYPPVSGGYSGGIMFHIGTWRSNGGDEFAPDAYLASREQQIIVAERVLAGSGWGAWPGCSRKYGWL